MNAHEQKLKALEERQRQVANEQSSIANEIEALREKLETPEPVVPWKPSGGGFYVDISGTIIIISGTGIHAVWNKAGRSFKTEEEAAKASEFFTFYQRLYQLAIECNAKHSDLGYFTASYSTSEKDWIVYIHQNETQQTPCDLFTSRLAAQEACDIMNRDGWKLPTSRLSTL